MRSLPSIIRGEKQDELVRSYTFSSDFEKVQTVNPAASEEVEYPETIDIFEDAIAQAEEILEKAREEAEHIRSLAEEEGRQAGYENGYEDGYKQAYADHKIKLDHEMDQFLREMKDSIEEVTQKKQLILDRYIDDLKRVTLAIAEKVIQTSLRTSGEVVKRMILAATSKLKKTQWAKVYITKSSLSIPLQGDVALLKELTYLSENIKLIAMESEEEGTCIIELPEEVIDASVSTQLENIRDILNNARL